jgi:hypothetical protein
MLTRPDATAQRSVAAAALRRAGPKFRYYIMTMILFLDLLGCLVEDLPQARGPGCTSQSAHGADGRLRVARVRVPSTCQLPGPSRSEVLSTASEGRGLLARRVGLGADTRVLDPKPKTLLTRQTPT